jgi:hypothetical protein
MGFNAFAIAPSQNKDDKHDATGAFHPGAHKLSKAYNCPWRMFDNSGSAAATRKSFLKTIETHCPGNCDLFAYFGHGYTNGLGSAHIGTAQLDEFVKVLQPKLGNPSVVVLYACSSGAAGGFTKKLREKLGGDVWVYGHTTVGHSFMNRDVSEEYGGNSPSFKLYYPPGDDLRAAWAEALKYTDLWLRFPMLFQPAIDAEVNSRRLLGTWEVNFGGTIYRYDFEDLGTVWSVASGRDIDAPPEGTVKAFELPNKKDVADKGTWKITDQVRITWESGWQESWPLPLHVSAQSGMSEGVLLTAKRLTHTLGKGKLQG